MKQIDIELLASKVIDTWKEDSVKAFNMMIDCSKPSMVYEAIVEIYISDDNMSEAMEFFQDFGSFALAALA